MVDVSDPTQPTELGFYDTPGWAQAVYVSGTLAYVAAVEGGLRVVDVSDPRRPREVGVYGTPWDEFFDVEVPGTLAYVAAGEGGLRMVDISDPGRPREVGVYDTLWGEFFDVEVSGTLAYVAAGYYAGLRVVDVSDPANPRELGFYDTPEYAYDVVVSGTLAYLAAGDGGLIILRYRPSSTVYLPLLLRGGAPPVVTPTPTRSPAPSPTATATPTVTATPTPTPTATPFAFLWYAEAEAGTLAPPMVHGEDVLASACGYTYSPVNSAGAVTLTITVPLEGAYYLWARVMGLSFSSNSFYVAMDNSPEIHYEIPQFDGQWTWGWHQVRTDIQPDGRYLLGAGEHTLRFRAREADARLDAVLLTADPAYVPASITPCAR